MKKMMTLVALVIGLLVGGCAPMVWEIKNGATQEQFERDKQECLYEAEKFGFVPITGNSNVPGADGISAGLQEGMRKRSLFQGCMKLKGHVLK